MIKWYVFGFILVWTNSSFGQSEQFYPQNWRTDTLNSTRLKTVAISGTAFYGVSMTGLYFAWYKSYSSEAFHTFDDGAEWEGMDKVGHSLTAYTLSRYGREALWYSGMNNTKSTLYGAGYAMLFQSKRSKTIFKVLCGSSGMFLPSLRSGPQRKHSN